MSAIEPVIAESPRERVLVDPRGGETSDDGPKSPLDRPGDGNLGAWSEGTEPYGDWELPGMGNSAPSCGEVRASSFCDTQGHVQYEKHLCGRRECPVCWNSQWSEPRTISAVSRLAAARHMEPEGLGRRTIHAVVSPSEGSIKSIEAVYEGRKKAIEIAKDHGIRGGVTIFHGYRVTQETKEWYEEEEPDLPMWRWVRENDRRWKDQVYWSPHYHIVGLSRDTKPGDTAKDDGWVFKNIRSLSPYEGPRDRDGTESMVRVIRYVLSHATYPSVEDRQAVTWFGDVHGSNFVPEEDISGGSWSVIERVVQEVVGGEGESESDEDGDRECPTDGCDGHLHDIFDARAFLRTNGDEIPPEARERIETAYEWESGFIEPPPGMKNPKTVEHADEALEVMIGG